MTVRDILQVSDSSVLVEVVEISTGLLICPPDWVGYYLTLDQSVLDEEVITITIIDSILCIGV